VPQCKVLRLRLDPKLTKRLDKRSVASQRTRTFLISEAVRGYVSLNKWHIDETKKALAEADRGDFASEKEVSRTLKKWKQLERNS
jgi:RHH-type transcriptional regulator, rel operon repressor / antitoxin RelB